MQWFKAHEGTDIDRNTKELAICTNCINDPSNVLYLPNTQASVLLKYSPMIKPPFNIQMYTGVAIMSKTGYAIGTVCVMDLKPKTLTQEQRDMLVLIRDQAMSLLELRRENLLLKSKTTGE